MPVFNLPRTANRRSGAARPAGLAVSAVGLAIAAVATVTSAGMAHSEEAPPAVEAAAVVDQQSVRDAVAQAVEQAPAPEAAPAPLPQPEVPVAPEPAPAPAAPVYADNLDGWIREAMDILSGHGVPASYDGIFRNIMRESTGNPQAINLYDSNAAAGIPSKGLLQVIDPTFQAYKLPGTSDDVYDPVANIVAACNYAAHRYGSMDNVSSAY
ncbi:transglycosylase SLT domain-containing protein [Rhodococcus sp. NPDC058521]|uniref:transglycosylase SLT domain-containing protein n=1 Tax=Rhodococcus sp. NPDC058521 TaxID=3346536 RepID=UPI003664A6EC